MASVKKESLKTILLASLITGFIIPTVYGLFLGARGDDPQISMWVTAFLYSTVITFLIFKVNAEIVFDMQQQIPWFKASGKRFVLELILTSLSAALIITISYYVLKNMLYPEVLMSDKEAILENVVIAVVANFFILSITEGRYFLEEWKRSHIESERLKRENLEMQYNALTQQIDPHFLFNSLNALASLIEEDPVKAVRFTRQFARIYRYVLDVRSQAFVKVSREVDFVRDYLELHQQRFGHNLIVRIETGNSTDEASIPPLSLQMLVENAIKHNEISRARPLEISIFDEEEYLLVVNTYQPRTVTESSPGTGWKNLRERYAHYSDIRPDFQLRDQWFEARLPLLRDE